MAYALSNTNTALGLPATLQTVANAWKIARAKRAVFNRTYNELNALDDRDLADIGIARGAVRNLAREVAEKAV